MPYSKFDNLPSVAIEELEGRRLFTGEPWGAIPRLIGQDSAVSNYPTLTGAGQTIAVIDTGIDYTHPALGGGFGAGFKVVDGYDFVDDDADPMDTYGHGTGVAGVLAAEPFVHLGKQYRGIAPQARLVALRIDSANDPVPDERIEEALDWVIDKRKALGITVVNISFGYGSFADAEVSAVFGDELKVLRDAGVFIVASSGNNGVSDPPAIQYPAADPSVYAVGSTDEFGVISEFTERSEDLDLLAPGNEVATTALVDADPLTEDFRRATGTSFAAPLAAGAVALMRQADASLRPSDIRSILRVSGVDTLDGDDEFGSTTNLTYARLHLKHALELTYDRKGGSLGATEEIASGGNNASIAHDEDDVLHVVYYDSVDRTLKHLVRASDGGWSKTDVIDDADADLGQYASMALDAMGRPAVAYFDGTAGDLKYAHYDGDDWIVERIDSKFSVGLYPTLAFDADNRPAISYYYKTGGDLRIARHDGVAWVIKTVDSSNDVGRSTSMAIDKDGKLAIAYENTTTGQLKYAVQSGTSWNKQVVDDETLGIAWPSLAFDGSNRPNISYYDADPANLKLARLKDGNWQTETLASKGAQGLFTTLVFDGSTANLFYYNRQLNEMHRLKGSFGNWSDSLLETGGGRYITAHRAHDGDLTYTWFETDEKILHVEDV
ncbi:MAG: S8/S53 family peptidase [Tepidisphaeraceae bacterium]